MKILIDKYHFRAFELVIDYLPYDIVDYINDVRVSPTRGLVWLAI